MLGGKKIIPKPQQNHNLILFLQLLRMCVPAETSYEKP